MNQDFLKLTRFKGEEIFKIKEAEIYLSEEKTELSLDFKTGKCISSPFEDTKQNGEITGEFWLFDINIADLKELEGKTFYIKDGYDNVNYEDCSLFYYYNHQSVSENVIEFIECNSECFVIKITANTCDVNFYDESKPKTKIEITAKFKI